jgi:TonB family protein
MRSTFALLVLGAALASAPARGQLSAADTSRVYELSEVEIIPVAGNVGDLLRALDALYPPHLRAAATPGTVQVELVVGTDGLPRDVRVVSTTDSAFSQPTVEALGVLRFHPANRGTGPVAVRVSFPVNWTVAGAAPAPAQTASSAPPPAAEPEPEAVSVPPELRNADEYASRMRALYPRDLRRAGVRGFAWVRIDVSAEGTVRNASIVRSSDPRFDAPSLQLVQTLLFRPATVDGEPKAVWIDFQVQWTF